MTIRPSATFLLGTCCTVLVACSTIPDAVSEPPTTDLTVKDIQSSQSGNQQATVRWGGTIAGVSNNDGSSDLLVVSRPLSGSTRPKQSDQSQGRFIARLDTFLEPNTYTDGREVTITGVVTGIESRPIGKANYPYPVVQVKGLHLWPVRSATSYNHSPYYAYPYYPYYYHPAYWWDNHHHRRGHNGVYGSFIFHRKL